MSYISHTSYTKMLEAFGKQSTKGILKEDIKKEGNAFTAGLAKTKKGGEFKVGNKKFKDKTNYDASIKEEMIEGEYDTTDRYDQPYDIFYINGEPYVESIDMYQFGDQVAYPNQKIAFKEKGRWVKAVVTSIKGDDRHHFNGLKLRVADPGTRSDGDYRMDEEGEVDEYRFDQMYPDDPGPFEGLNPAPLQAIGQTIMRKESTDYNFSVLSQTERDQLKEYIKSLKTIKEEINKLMGKAKGVEEGGDMTNLLMKELGPAAMQAAGDPGEEAGYRGSLVKRRGTASPEEVEKKVSPEMHSKVHKTLDALRAALEADGLEGWEIEMFIKHEIEKKGGEATMGQHDPY